MRKKLSRRQLRKILLQEYNNAKVINEGMSEKAKLSIKCITENLFENNYKICEDLIDTSLKINGFGHVKDKKIAQYENVWEKLLLKITEIKIKKVS